METTWELVQLESEDKQREFVDEVIGTKPSKVGDMLAKRRRLINSAYEGIAGEWMSFHQAAGKDGRETILEMIQNGSMTSRPNRKLSADTKIPWPENLEVAYTREEWHSGKETKAETELTEEQVYVFMCTPSAERQRRLAS